MLGDKVIVPIICAMIVGYLYLGVGSVFKALEQAFLIVVIWMVLMAIINFLMSTDFTADYFTPKSIGNEGIDYDKH